jgi:hypothetical protein
MSGAISLLPLYAFMAWTGSVNDCHKNLPNEGKDFVVEVMKIQLNMSLKLRKAKV